jgi:hypothetical protein
MVRQDSGVACTASTACALFDAGYQRLLCFGGDVGIGCVLWHVVRCVLSGCSFPLLGGCGS